MRLAQNIWLFTICSTISKINTSLDLRIVIAERLISQKWKCLSGFINVPKSGQRIKLSLFKQKKM